MASTKQNQVWKLENYRKTRIEGTVQTHRGSPAFGREFNAFHDKRLELHNLTADYPTQVKHFEGALRLLERNKVRPFRTKISDAFVDLLIPHADFCAANRYPWRAFLLTSLAHDFAAETKIIRPSQVFENFEADDAYQVYLARKPFDAAQDSESRDPSVWHRVLSKAVITHELRELFLEAGTPEQRAIAALLGMAVSKKTALTQVKKVSQRLDGHYAEPLITNLILAHEKTGSFEKTVILSSAIDSIADMKSGFVRYLAWAACARFFWRLKKYDLVKTIVNQMPKPDPLFLFPESINKKLDGEFDRLPEKKTERIRFVGGLFARVCLEVGAARARALFGTTKQSKRVSSSEFDMFVRIAGEKLYSLRGPMAKLLQLTDAYREQGALRHEGQTCESMSRDAILNTFMEDQGRSLFEVFSEFDFCPIGFGSIGQVHKARLKDGSAVAVKIQFPNIERIIDSDIATLRRLERVIGITNPNIRFRAITDEMHGMFRDECDFIREAGIQQSFHDKWSCHPRISIPLVFHEFSSRKILVSEFVVGLSFDEFSATADQSARNIAGEALVEFGVTSCVDGCFNTDPNDGNFIFAGDKIFMIDFGSIKKWPTERTDAWNRIIRSGLIRDKNMYIQAAKDVGLVTNAQLYDFDYGFDHMLSGVMCEVGEDKECPLSLKRITHELRNMFSKSNKNYRYRSLDPEFLLSFRVYFGQSAMVAKLGSKANWHRITRKAVGLPLP